jgi:hypothetical protein
MPYWVDGALRISESDAILLHVAKAARLMGSTDAKRAQALMLLGVARDLRGRYVSLSYGPDFAGNRGAFEQGPLAATVAQLEAFAVKHAEAEQPFLLGGAPQRRSLDACSRLTHAVCMPALGRGDGRGSGVVRPARAAGDARAGLPAGGAAAARAAGRSGCAAAGASGRSRAAARAALTRAVRCAGCGIPCVARVHRPPVQQHLRALPLSAAAVPVLHSRTAALPVCVHSTAAGTAAPPTQEPRRAHIGTSSSGHGRNSAKRLQSTSLECTAAAASTTRPAPASSATSLIAAAGFSPTR